MDRYIFLYIHMYAQICILFALLCFDRTSLGVSTNCFVIVVVFVIVLIAHFPISFSSRVSFSLRSPCVVVASVLIVVVAFPSLAYLCRCCCLRRRRRSFCFYLSLVFCFCFISVSVSVSSSVFGLSRCSFASSSSLSSFSYSQRVHLKFAPARAGHSFNFTLNASTTS